MRGGNLPVLVRDTDAAVLEGAVFEVGIFDDAAFDLVDDAAFVLRTVDGDAALDPADLRTLADRETPAPVLLLVLTEAARVERVLRGDVSARLSSISC